MYERDAGALEAGLVESRAGLVELRAAARRVLAAAGGVRASEIGLNDALDALRAALGEGPDLRALADLPICHDCPIGNRAADHPDHDLTRGPCPRGPLCDHECEQEMAAYAAEEERTDADHRARRAAKIEQHVDIVIGLHPFMDAGDHYEDGVPGRCAFPLCTLRPEEHEAAAAHDCEEHPELPGRCRVCGLATRKAAP